MRVATGAELTTRRLADRLVDTGTLPRRDWHRALALILAMLVPSAWLAVAALGAVAFVWAHPVWWPFGVALIGGAVMLRPRAVRIVESDDVDDPRVAVRSPALDGALAALAAATGTAPPDMVFVTLDPDVALVHDSFGRRRVLLVGMALWALLDDGARQAAVVHELAHQAERDPRRFGPVGVVRGWLLQWSHQLRPGAQRSAAGRPSYELHLIDPQVVRRSTQAGLDRSSVTRVVGDAFLAAVGGVVRATSRLLDRLIFVPHQRAELRADQIAMRLAGTDAVRELLAVVPFRRRAGLSAHQSLRRTDGVGLCETVVDHLRAMPDHQREGLAVAVSNEEVTADQVHAPVRLRRELVDRLPAEAGSGVVDEATWQAACADLDAALAGLEQELRPRLRHSR